MDVLSNSNPAPRVYQLDAIELDKEITKLVKNKLLQYLQIISPDLVVKFQPEIDLILNSFIWCLSIAKHSSTFGGQILLLTYNKNKLTKNRLIIHFVLSIVPKYIKATANYRLTTNQFIQDIVNYCERFFIFLSIVNFFRFFKNGKYPTLPDLICGLDILPVSQENRWHRIIYHHMTRELLWTALMDFTSTILPLINFHKIEKLYKKLIYSNISGTRNKVAISKFDLKTKCIKCNQRPSHPQQINCGHFICYYCVQEDSICPKCFNEIVNVEPVEFERNCK